MGLSEQVSCITPGTSQYTSVSSIDHVNSGSHEVSATSIVGEQVDSTSFAFERADKICIRSEKIFKTAVTDKKPAQ